MEGHALVARLGSGKGNSEKQVQFPFLALLISGGHTLLVVCCGVGQYIQLGTTLDDPIGEAYDKVARMLNLEWHGGGGKALEQLALNGKPNPDYTFTQPMKQIKNCNLSFSGLKTAVKQKIQQIPDLQDRPNVKADIAYSFQKTAVEHVTDRVDRALTWSAGHVPTVTHLVVAGGVASNSYIRERLLEVAEKFKIGFYVPPVELCTDNGVMIAWAGVENFLAGKSIFGFEEAQGMGYEPKWKLDYEKKDYFPGAHVRDPNRVGKKIPLGIMTKCSKLISEGQFHDKVFRQAVSFAIDSRDFPLALWVCDEAIRLIPENKPFRKLRVKVLSQRQSAHMRENGKIL